MKDRGSLRITEKGFNMKKSLVFEATARGNVHRLEIFPAEQRYTYSVKNECDESSTYLDSLDTILELERMICAMGYKVS